MRFADIYVNVTILHPAYRLHIHMTIIIDIVAGEEKVRLCSAELYTAAVWGVIIDCFSVQI